MTASKRDPLLTAARIVITLMMVLCAAGAIGTLIGAPLVQIWQGPIMTRLTTEAGHAVDPRIITGISLLLLFASALLALGVYFLLLLRRIIDSVAADETFSITNAARLSRMGWICVVVEVLSIPAGASAYAITHAIRHDRVDIGFSLGGVLLALVLFILARVFREGARMREELEGTV
jgi:hypothetical protein